MIETRERKERVILIAVDLGDGTEVEASLAELAELADTAGAETVGTLIQNREAVHAGTYIGKGKIEELRELIHLYEADTVSVTMSCRRHRLEICRKNLAVRSLTGRY